MPFYPFHQYVYHVLLLRLTELPAGFDPMPFLKASSAAGSGSVLRNKDRMTFHWCLLSIIGYNLRGKTLRHKILCMAPYRFHPFICNIGSVLIFELEPASEN